MEKLESFENHRMLFPQQPQEDYKTPLDSSQHYHLGGDAGCQFSTGDSNEFLSSEDFSNYPSSLSHVEGGVTLTELLQEHDAVTEHILASLASTDNSSDDQQQLNQPPNNLAVSKSQDLLGGTMLDITSRSVAPFSGFDVFDNMEQQSTVLSGNFFASEPVTPSTDQFLTGVMPTKGMWSNLPFEYNGIPPTSFGANSFVPPSATTNGNSVLSNVTPASLAAAVNAPVKKRVGRPPKDKRRTSACSDSSILSSSNSFSISLAEKKRRLRRASGPKPNHALPATMPVTEVLDGIEYISFTYSVKGQNIRYRIRADIDHVRVDQIDSEFRRENCLYPRAYCAPEHYTGNRWEYESSCNVLGWKLAHLNPEVLGARRGLLQRAVDSYRNRCPEMRSRRVVRQEKLKNGTLRKRHSRSEDGVVYKNARLQYLEENGSRSVGFENEEFSVGGAEGESGSGESAEISGAEADELHRLNMDNRLSVSIPQKFMCFEAQLEEDAEPTRMRVRVALDLVDLNDIPEEFKLANCAYPRALEGDGEAPELERALNEYGWKLAWLNQSKLANNPMLLRIALDAYRSRFLDMQPMRRHSFPGVDMGINLNGRGMQNAHPVETTLFFPDAWEC
ncbi:uncharacterized protein VTP21DRAFT_4492 [Calcarisporiella thermophila]|uniref:uncharacterized protein n=1 Tax=Calcarisporiella thermophila TaxID=911321 RepID=UPI0037448C67